MKIQKMRSLLFNIFCAAMVSSVCPTFHPVMFFVDIAGANELLVAKDSEPLSGLVDLAIASHDEGLLDKDVCSALRLKIDGSCRFKRLVRYFPNAQSPNYVKVFEVAENPNGQPDIVILHRTLNQPVNDACIYLTSPNGRLRNALHIKSDGANGTVWLLFSKDPTKRFEDAPQKFQEAVAFWLKLEQHLRNNPSPKASPKP